MARIRNVFGNHLGLDMPVFGIAHGMAVTSAPSRAGGIGAHGIAHDSPDRIGPKREVVRGLATHVPIGADVMMPKGMPEDQCLRQAQAGPCVAWTRAPRPVKDVVNALTAQRLAALDAMASIAQQR